MDPAQHLQERLPKRGWLSSLQVASIEDNEEVLQGVVSKNEVEALTWGCYEVAHREVAFVYIASDGSILIGRPPVLPNGDLESGTAHIKENWF